MRAVNLLQDDGRRRQEDPKGRLTTTSVAIAGGGLLAIAVVLVGFLFVQSRGTVSDKRAALRTVQQQVTDAQAAAAPVATPSGHQAQLAAFNAAASDRVSWDTLLGDVAKVLPAGSWVSSLTMHMPSATTAAAATTTAAPATGTAAPPVGDPTTFVISGVALSHDVVARVMQRLALVPMLSDVSLQSSAEADVGTQKAFQFSMNAILGSAGAGSDE